MLILLKTISEVCVGKYKSGLHITKDNKNEDTQVTSLTSENFRGGHRWDVRFMSCIVKG